MEFLKLIKKLLQSLPQLAQPLDSINKKLREQRQEEFKKWYADYCKRHMPKIEAEAKAKWGFMDLPDPFRG